MRWALACPFPGVIPTAFVCLTALRNKMNILGIIGVVIVAGVLALNSVVMIISPRAWFRLPTWIGGQGGLSEEKYARGFGAARSEDCWTVYIGLDIVGRERHAIRADEMTKGKTGTGHLSPISRPTAGARGCSNIVQRMLKVCSIEGREISRKRKFLGSFGDRIWGQEFGDKFGESISFGDRQHNPQTPKMIAMRAELRPLYRQRTPQLHPRRPPREIGVKAPNS